MAGIYLHIPWCRQACHYCNFHFSTSLRTREAVLRAMAVEMEQKKEFLGGEPLETVYLGGGTPSVLSTRELDQLLQTVQTVFGVTTDAEITLEANPDDLTPEYLAGIRGLGINRLSIGIQALDDDLLRYMNRSHNAAQAMRSLDQAAAAGFTDMNADLIYGLPGLADRDWESALEDVLRFPVTHLSAYALTVEPRTALDYFIRQKGWQGPDDEAGARHFLIASQFLESRGWEHYEVSNFALPGRRSRHNSSYWKGLPYLGIGPSAHSFRHGIRSWNVSSNGAYARQGETGRFEPEREILSFSERFNEYVMTGLRTREGISLQETMMYFGPEAAGYLESALNEIPEDQVAEENGRYRLTLEGWLFGDAIASSCFLDDDDGNLIPEFPEFDE